MRSVPSKTKKKKDRRWWRLTKLIIAWMVIGQFVYIIFTTFFNPPVTCTQFVELIRGNGLKRDYVAGNEISPNLKLAVIAAEDQLFPDHNGFDIKSIRKAMKYNEKHPTRTRGASTISQQTAKNVFLWQGGGYIRKGLEVYFTFMIEKIWEKERILTRYLNVAEMGRGIFGAQAAARAYFNKDAINLTRQEAAMIAACLPNPKKYTVKPMSRYVARRYPHILRQMNNLSADPDIAALLE